MRINSEITNPEIPLGSKPQDDGSHKIFSTRTVEKIDNSAMNYKTANPETVVYLRSNLKTQSDGGEPLALFERDEQHPNDEVFISGSVIVPAALTPKVVEALERGNVVEVSQGEYDEQEQQKPAREPSVTEQLKGWLS